MSRLFLRGGQGGAARTLVGAGEERFYCPAAHEKWCGRGGRRRKGRKKPHLHPIGAGPQKEASIGKQVDTLRYAVGLSGCDASFVFR